jgi:hypothetical protein
MKDIQKIKEMVGNAYKYKGKTYTIRGFAPEDDTVRIYTNQEDIVLHDGGNLGEALAMFRYASNVPAVIERSEMQATMSSLTTVVMESIEKVRNNKDYIPQADSINSSIKTLIDMAKAEIDYNKTQLEFMKLKQVK